MSDGIPGDGIENGRARVQMERLVSFTIWELLKWILSDRLLWLSACLLPDKSDEKDELLVFLSGYMKRSLARRAK